MNYLSNKTRCSCAYLELNGSPCISALSKKPDCDSFHYYGMNLYPNGTFAKLPEYLQYPYESFVLDLGVLNRNNYGEFIQSDLCFVIGDLCAWKKDQFGAFLQHYFKTNKECPDKIRFLAFTGLKENQKIFMRQYGFSVEMIPFFENLFQLSYEDWHFIKAIL